VSLALLIAGGIVLLALNIWGEVRDSSAYHAAMILFALGSLWVLVSDLLTRAA
jgi:hypothetical protein